MHQHWVRVYCIRVSSLDQPVCQSKHLRDRLLLYIKQYWYVCTYVYPINQYALYELV